MPGAFRHKTVAGTLAEIAEAAAEASGRGSFAGPEAHVSRVVLAIDEAGSDEIAALDEAREAALRINAASAARQAAQGPGAPPPVATELALIHLRQATK